LFVRRSRSAHAEIHSRRRRRNGVIHTNTNLVGGILGDLGRLSLLVSGVHDLDGQEEGHRVGRSLIVLVVVVVEELQAQGQVLCVAGEGRGSGGRAGL
jgi:hypothetical protein